MIFKAGRMIAFSLTVALFATLVLTAKDKPVADAPESLRQQLSEWFAAHPTGRVYIQTDKPLYKPGETIWFKTSVFDTVTLAQYKGLGAYELELLDPRGSTVMKKMVKLTNGSGENDVVIPEGVVGGEFTLRATTSLGVNGERPITIQAYQAPLIQKKLRVLGKGYGAGDRVEAKAEFRSGTGEQLASHPIQAVVRVDGRTVHRLSLKTDADGELLVTFDLPEKVTTEDALLTLVVSEGGITESISRTIPILLSRLNVDFYPEGGELVAGLPSRVYFQALKPNGKPAEVTGRIVDLDDNEVARISSYHHGMGRFSFTPAKDASYRLIVERPVGVKGTFMLPAAKASGVVMAVGDDLGGLRTDCRVTLHSTDAMPGVTVVATLRDRVVATHSLDLKAGENHVTLMPKLGQGVMRVTALAGRTPLAERVVYRQAGVDMKVQIEAEKEHYMPREEVKLSIRTTLPDGTPVPAELALAVVDDRTLTFADDKTAHLLSHIYLEKDLPGDIEEPNFYFDPKEEKAPLALELLMGTRGWRTFEWQRLDDKPDQEIVVDDQLLGRIHGSSEESVDVKVLLEQGQVFYRNQRYMDAREKFEQVLIRDPTNREATQHLQAVYNHLSKDAKLRRWAMIAERAAEIEWKWQDHIRGGRPIPVPVPGAAPVAGAEMPPIPMLAAPPMPKAAPAEAAVPVPEPNVPADPAPVPAMAAKVMAPPVIAGAKKPMADMEADDMVMDMPVVRELQEEVAWAGKERKDRFRRIMPTWAVVRVFPEVRYASTETAERTDFRETILWAPRVETDAQGHASVSFFLSDAVSAFRVTAEGTANDGLLGRAEEVIDSRTPVHVDGKLPVVLSMGDTLELPLRFTNETDQPMTVTGNMIMPEGFAATRKAFDFAAPFSLGAGEAKTYYAPLRAMKAASGQLVYSVKAGGLSETVKRPIRIEPVGFPRSYNESDTLAKTRAATFELPKAVVPGSLSATLKLYPSPMATMLDGLDRILREPCGCFEQTSSSTYPNIMVLSYLQRSGTIAPEVEKRAHELVGKGYNRLIGFECTDKGYEWFGRGAGHEALTAYGIMEFLDMAKVYDKVDPEMVKRTVQWILAQRDGEGGFKRNARALDSFGRATPEVTNAYIVWALTEAGIDGIDKEIEALTKQAYETRNTYLLALAALAQANRDPKSDEARELAELLNNARTKDGHFEGEGQSITGSRGNYLHVETTSLAILALLKTGTPAASLNDSVQWLIQQRSGGGFGPTQSTVLALKALTAYAEASRVTTSDGDVVIRVNGSLVARQHFNKGDQGVILIDGFEKLLTEGENHVDLQLISDMELPYNLEVTYKTAAPVSGEDLPVTLETALEQTTAAMGDAVTLNATVRNTTDKGQAMTLARIGIPAGLQAQTWQLKELRENGAIDFYETTEREVILYWRGLAPNAEKQVRLSLNADLPGSFTGIASNAYLYYNPDSKSWNQPLKVQISHP